MRKGSFQAGLKDFSKEAQRIARKNVRKTLIAGLSGCISRSPVDTANFRLNWTIQANSPNPESSDKGILEPGGGKKPIPASPDELVLAEKAGFKLGDQIFISNALPYARRIEGGWSDQAEAGVVAPTIRELERLIKEGALD